MADGYGFPEDLDLARRCAAGEEEAWQVLVARFTPSVRNWARRIVGMEELEDAVAEVFAHLLGDACRPLRLYRGEAPLEAYLRVVASRLLWSRRDLERTGIRAPEALEAVAPGVGPGDLLEERLEALRRECARLSEEDRRLLGALYGQGLTHREAARALGIPPGTVASRAARLLSRLEASCRRGS